MRAILRNSLLTCCALAGCTSQSPVSRQALIGRYVYKSQDPEGKASDHEWDRLTLQADGKYDLVQGGPTKAKSEKTGFWSFTGGDPAQVMLDHAGYPAVVKGGEVRLMIDYDTGIWYAKAKRASAGRLRRRQACVCGVHLACMPPERKTTLLRIGSKGDTSPQNGSCTAT